MFVTLALVQKMKKNILSEKLFCRMKFKPFVPNTPFLYLLKTSENRKIF